MPQDPPPVSVENQAILLQTARDSILHGFDRRRGLAVDPACYPEELRPPAPVFVTLMLADQLQGCVGTLESSRSLVANTAYYAHAAAFSDSRFSPLEPGQFRGLDIKISILSPLELLSYSSEPDLLRQIRPGVDGLLFEDDGCRGTFLPSVWESIPEPAQFLGRLKVKAGLYPDYWSETVRVSRYTVFAIEGKADSSFHSSGK